MSDTLIMHLKCLFLIFAYCISLDINECLDISQYTCDVNAVCVNTIGNYTCQCNDGYMGNGKVCSGKFYISFSNCFIMALVMYYLHVCIDACKHFQLAENCVSNRKENM